VIEVSKREVKSRIERLECVASPEQTHLIWKDRAGYHVDGILNEEEFTAWCDKQPENAKIYVIGWVGNMGEEGGENKHEQKRG
jgi:hypothetical protein